MSTPDAAAAAAPQHVLLHKLTHEHVNAVVSFKGTTGTLIDLPAPTHGGLLAVPIQQQGKPYVTMETGGPDDAVEIAHDAPPSPHDEQANVEAKTPEHLVHARELAEIEDAIAAHTGEIDGLKARHAELSKAIMSYFELAGDTQIAFDNRLAYLKSRTFPVYRDRPASEGGGKYSSDEVVEALREIGRAGDIKPPSINPQTLGAILREYRDAEKAVPEKLAKLVELGEEYSVKVGAPGRKRR